MPNRREESISSLQRTRTRVRAAELGSFGARDVYWLFLAAGMVAGCASSSATQPSWRLQVTAVLSRSAAAIETKNIDAFMATFPSDCEVRVGSVIVSPEKLRADTLREWSSVTKTLSISDAIGDFSVDSDIVVMIITHSWERRERWWRAKDKPIDTVLTVEKQREAWRRCPTGWCRYDVQELGGETFINGEPYTW